MNKLSIITVNYNNVVGLKRTMSSVFCQTFQDFEYIIIDGGSTDGSKSHIEDNSHKLRFWTSETDHGVYHAMNKGIYQAEGNYLLFLNSGDILSDPSILEQCFNENFQESFVYCNVQSQTTGVVITYPEKLRFSHFYHSTINHQSTFIKRDLFDKYGMYNEKYSISSDWEFFVKCLFLGSEDSRYINKILTQFDYSDGLSMREENQIVMINEKNEILGKYFSGFVADYEEMEYCKKLFQQRNETSIRMNTKMIKVVRKIRRLTQLR